MSKVFRSFGTVWENPTGKRAILSCFLCVCCFLYLFYVVSATRSLVLTNAAWLTIFSFFAVFSTVLNLGVHSSPTEKYTYGYVRAAVLTVFSTSVLAQLSAILQLKEAFESFVGHHHGPGHGAAHGHAVNHYFYSAAAVSSFSLFLAAYSVTNQPFQHVLTASQSSSLQEHATDISYFICQFFPGMSRFLLPRLNAMSLLAFISSTCCILTHWFMNDFEWFDSLATVILSGAIFSTMYPLTYYTGMILLQTTPTHVHAQIDRCLSEATTVDGVLELKNSHFWQLDFNTIAGTVDVRIRRDADEQVVLAMVTEKLYSVINNLSIQVVKDSGWDDHTPSYVPQIPVGAYTGNSHSHGHNHDHSHGQNHSHHGHSHDHHGHNHEVQYHHH